MVVKFWKTFAVLLYLFDTSAIHAQQVGPLEIGNKSDKRVAISTGRANQRVGNAVLVRVHVLESDSSLGETSLVLLACDGSWISTSIQTVYKFKFDKKSSFAELEKYTKQREESVPLDSVEFLPPSENPFFLASLLRKQYLTACRNAGREPRNQLVPVIDSKSGDNEYRSISIVSGTATKVAESIEVWTRSTSYKYVDVIDTNGKPVEIDGVALKKKEQLGKYSLNRVVFDCRNRQIGTLEFVDYKDSKSTPDTQSIPREKLSLTSVVPGSVGEGKLDAVCLLYGSAR